MCKVPHFTSIANRYVLLKLGQQFSVIYFIHQSTYSGLATCFAVYNAFQNITHCGRIKHIQPVSQLDSKLYGKWPKVHYCLLHQNPQTSHITFFEKCRSSLAATYCIIFFGKYQSSLAARSVTISLADRPHERCSCSSKWQTLFVR